jgi:cell division septation protein DedD
MSQNDPGGFDRDFLSSDVDLQIGHPSPGAEIYTRSSSGGLPSWRMIGVFLLLGSGALGSTYYYAFQQGLAEGQRSLPPVVLADNTPLKVSPDNVPGGVADAPQDLNIYGVMRGDDKNTFVTPKITSPADNAPGTIESLIAQTDDPFAEALESTQEADNAAPSGNSIAVLRERDDVKVDPPRPELNRAPRVAPEAPAASPTPKATPQSAAKPVARTGTRQDYMVQLAASRSRALARGVYSSLQSNYNDLLGRRDPLILRVDLGDKGIFYRVNVPGFASRDAANAFCATLKKRGQDCLVRKQN